MRRSTKTIALLGVLAIAAASAWWALAPASVQVSQPTRGPAVHAVYATGIVEPSLEIRIAPRAAGRIVELKVDEGDVVKRGALLARLEDADLQSAAAELDARVVYAEAQYKRTLELRRQALISQDAADRSRADLDAARAAAKRARDQLQYMRLIAPVDGTIIRRDGEVGEMIPVNQTVFYMAGPAPLRISADVDEEDVPRIAVGQRVLIQADAFPGRTFEGRVAQLTPRGDPVQRSYRVRISFMDDVPLAIGMTTETNIVLDERENALLVPSSAVANGRVWVLQGNRVQPRDVDVGVVGPERTEVRGGLSDEETIVVQPSEDLKAGTRVRAIAVAATGPAGDTGAARIAAGP